MCFWCCLSLDVPRFPCVGVYGAAIVSCKNNRIMKMKVTSKTITCRPRWCTTIMYIIDFKAPENSTQCIGQSRKELRKILIGWLQKHRLPTRFCLAFFGTLQTFQATHNVGLFPPRRCISDVRLFLPRSCNVRPFPPGRRRTPLLGNTRLFPRGQCKYGHPKRQGIHNFTLGCV